jgi:hypothetical protein
MTATGQSVKQSSLTDVIRPGTTRGLDFVILEELRKRTGVEPKGVLKWAVVEILCNALDTDATEIYVKLADAISNFVVLTVSDNGSQKLTIDDLKLILNFENKASSKRGLLRVSRGYLGNALKCLFGYSYALIESVSLPTQNIVVESGPKTFTISLKPDKIREIINSEIEAKDRTDDRFTTFRIMFPKETVNVSELQNVIFATSLVNPARKIIYTADNETRTYKWTENIQQLRQETSILWYSSKQFQDLFKDYVRAVPRAQLKQFIAIFRGFTSKQLIREILQKLTASNRDSEANGEVQFLPTTMLSALAPSDVVNLYAIMKTTAKPIESRSIPSVLGSIGEEALTKVKEANEWQRVRYVLEKSERTEVCEKFGKKEYMERCFKSCQTCSDRLSFPYLVELAVFDRKADDTEGLQVYQCVNFMASMEDVFSRIFDIPYRLGRVGITKESPVTVLAHLVCPVLKWLNYGKSGLDE